MRTGTPRISLHFTPTSGSWLNLVEIFFSIITLIIIAVLRMIAP